MKKLPPCLNPKCRRRKVLSWWTSANLLSRLPVQLPIHSTDDVALLIADDEGQAKFPTGKEFLKV